MYFAFYIKGFQSHKTTFISIFSDKSLPHPDSQGLLVDHDGVAGLV